MDYAVSMLHIRTTETFDVWFDGLRDAMAKRRIQARIDRLQLGNPGDTNSAGGAVRELRIDHGPGYRVYYTQRGSMLVILLCGGDKRNQQADIRMAHRLAENLDTE
jgi:putative addiction module killer protein